ncbi:MAG: hypothetical protein M1817_006447 [Caeruleum heppii]|nr:MAG: hypothetical protein M1817_006447 [Caeruleum heppii]
MSGIKCRVEQEEDDESEGMTILYATATGADGRQVGTANARIINRRVIRREFYENMEAASEDAATAASDLFDRWGCLKQVLIDHPFKKGSGVWGRELDNGSFLLIEEILVQESHQRQGLGTRLARLLFKKAAQRNEDDLEEGVSFAIAWPTGLNWAMPLRIESVGEADARISSGSDASVAFFRHLGYRRIGATEFFGLTDSRIHRSKQLHAADDFDPPPMLSDPLLNDDDVDPQGVHALFDDATGQAHRVNVLERMMQRLPLHHALSTFDDDDCVASMQRFQSSSSAEDLWVRVDRQGNTILHLAAVAFKARSVRWIMACTFGPVLMDMRNRAGDTPLEALQLHTDSIRVHQDLYGVTAHVSDDFRGMPPAAVSCVVALRRLHDPIPAELQRVRFGCSCGRCVDGIMSKRMQAAIVEEASVVQSRLESELAKRKTAPRNRIISYYQMHTMHLPNRLQKAMHDSRGMREGYRNLYGYLAKCVEDQAVPSDERMLQVIERASENPAVTKEFLSRGGTIDRVRSDVLKGVIVDFLRDGEEAGFGDYPSRNEDRPLPRCRNDHEYPWFMTLCAEMATPV